MIINSQDATIKKKSAINCIEQLASPEYSTYRKLWELCEDVIAGELTVKNKADVYIYRPVAKRGNTPDAQARWEAYKSRGKLPKFPAETLEKMTGTICANPPALFLDGKGKRLDYMRETATPYRDGLDALFGRTVENVIKYGRYCLLLEPDEEGDIFHINEFRAEKFLRAVPVEKNGNSYAKLILLDTSNIRYDYRNWRDVYCPQITLLALDGRGVYYQAKFGSGEVPIKGYDESGTPQWKSKRQHLDTMGEVFSVLENFNVDDPDPEGVTVPTKYGRTFDRIPFTVVNPTNLNFMRFYPPPLLDMCVKSVHILNADCDHQQAIFMTTDPIPVITGTDRSTKITLSADRFLNLQDNADFKFVVAPAAGLQMQAENIQTMTADAEKTGLNIAGTEGAANTSGVALEILRNAQTAALRMINQTCAKAIEEQLRGAGEWINMSVDERLSNIKFTPSKELAKIKPSLQDAVSLGNAAAKFSITKQELREWAEENLGFEHQEWDELQAKLDAEADVVQTGLDFNLPPVSTGDNVEQNDGEDNKKKEETEVNGNVGRRKEASTAEEK